MGRPHRADLKKLFETPRIVAATASDQPDLVAAATLLAGIRASGRVLLTQDESKRVLAAHRIPVAPTLCARSPEEAAAAAVRIGFPVAVKLHSETITHKAAVGGVRLDVRDAGEVRVAWREIEAAVLARAGPNHFLGVTVEPMVRGDGLEAILGSTCDPQCGPVILFGTGGSHVALHQDRTLGLPPLDRNLARRMIGQTRLGAALQDGPVAQREALEELLVRFAGLVLAHPVIKEIDLNPIFIASGRIVVLDARIILHAAGVVQLPSAIARPDSGFDPIEVHP